MKSFIFYITHCFMVFQMNSEHNTAVHVHRMSLEFRYQIVVFVQINSKMFRTKFIDLSAAFLLILVRLSVVYKLLLIVDFYATMHQIHFFLYTV